MVQSVQEGWIQQPRGRRCMCAKEAKLHVDAHVDVCGYGVRRSWRLGGAKGKGRGLNGVYAYLLNSCD